MMRQSGEGLWRFALALYARPRVDDALIALQDRTGHDVNLILFALSLGATRRRRLDAAGLDAAAAIIAPFNAAAVGPLRALRCQLKTGADTDLQAVRRRVLALELAAERLLLLRLAALFPAASGEPAEDDGLAAAEANLALYLGDDAGSPEARLICRALAALAGARR